MKNQLISEITRQMIPYLDNAQMEQLQEVQNFCLILLRFWAKKECLIRNLFKMFMITME